MARFGKATKSLERCNVVSEEWAAWRARAQQSLRYPAVTLSGIQARGVGAGFANGVRRSGYAIWACSILPEHVHLVIARHTYKVEQICTLLKGEATKQLKKEKLHPQTRHADVSGKLPSMWSENEWKVYLDSEEAIENAIRYVEDNPTKEGKPAQKWSFVTPFVGVDKGGWTTYH